MPPSSPGQYTMRATPAGTCASNAIAWGCTSAASTSTPVDRLPSDVNDQNAILAASSGYGSARAPGPRREYNAPMDPRQRMAAMMTGFAHGALTRTRLRLAAAALGSTLVLAAPALAQDGAVRLQPTPVRQSALTRETAPPPAPLTLRDASRTDRWLGVPVSDVRWAPDGTAVYFRWNESPGPADDPAGDPWYRVD